jgi:uncharacterized radical SAM superfamily Fe-S cluster-containing enzyme
MHYEKKGPHLENPRTETKRGCPYDCGLCPQHETPTVLANIDITNRCNLRCPICFANAAQSGYVFEPSMDEIRKMMVNLRSNRPFSCPAVQLSGGEPTVRDDLPEIIEMAREIGFPQVQIASNGVRLAKDPTYAARLKEVGLSTVYLQFDGVKERPYVIARGYNALPQKIKAIENCDRAHLGVVLVPTLVRNVNDDQLGGMINFAVNHINVVRALNIQPESFCGRTDLEDLQSQRITIPDVLNKIEEQTDGQLGVEDFYPVPFVAPISEFVTAWSETYQVEFTCHPACGAATYIFISDGKLIPITRFVDVEGFFGYLKEMIEELKNNPGRITKSKIFLRLAKNFGKFVDDETKPPELKIRSLMTSVLGSGTYSALGDFHSKTLMIGIMHFMDPYNLDIQRVSKCAIHYATPDGRIIPFCSYNTIHREEVEKDLGIPVEQWERAKGKLEKAPEITSAK